jgi:hypothetical protein
MTPQEWLIRVGDEFDDEHHRFALAILDHTQNNFPNNDKLAEDLAKRGLPIRSFAVTNTDDEPLEWTYRYTLPEGDTPE